MAQRAAFVFPPITKWNKADPDRHLHNGRAWYHCGNHADMSTAARQHFGAASFDVAIFGAGCR